jgi:hypothetical protein
MTNMLLLKKKDGICNNGNNLPRYQWGDGARWIADQVNAKFGVQPSYLINFFHVCEYLADALKTTAKDSPQIWMKTQKSLLKNNDFSVVIANLIPYLEADGIDNDKAPVRACHRYLSNRTDQLDYRGAIEKGLPIGSGEIESAHRYVIQKRLKLPGAWWKVTHIGRYAELCITVKPRPSVR